MQQHRCNRVERASNGETPYRLRPHRLATALTEEVILVRAVQFRAIIERAAMLVATGLYRATVCQVWECLLHSERSKRDGRKVGLPVQKSGRLRARAATTATMLSQAMKLPKLQQRRLATLV